MIILMKCRMVGMAEAGLSKTQWCYKSFANYLTNYKKSRSGINDQDRELLYFHMNQYVELHGRRRSIGEWYLPIKGGYRMQVEVTSHRSASSRKGFGDVQDYFHSTYPDM